MRFSKLLAIGAALLISACACVSKFSPEAYQAITDLKYHSLYLVRQAEQPFNRYREQADSLLAKGNRLLEQSKARAQNEITTAQLEKLMNPEGHLLGGYLVRWKERDTLPQIFIRSASASIEKSFDEILKLELGKVKK